MSSPLRAPFDIAFRYSSIARTFKHQIKTDSYHPMAIGVINFNISQMSRKELSLFLSNALNQGCQTHIPRLNRNKDFRELFVDI